MALLPARFLPNPSFLARWGLVGAEAVRDGEARLRMLTRQMPAIIWSTDAAIRITSSHGDGLGWLASVPVAAHRRALEAEAVDFEMDWLGRTIQAHVEPLHGPGGKVTGTIGVAFDVTERRRAEEQRRQAALHDDLTQLPNRTLFIDRLGHALDRARRRNDPFALLLLDLDRFKTVNDSLGHVAGDRLLAASARRLCDCVRPGDTVARLGGDEFTILLEEIAGPGDPVRVAERVQYELAAPFDLDGHEVVTAASIGIAVGGPGYQRPEDILRDADIAMYRAKALGRGRHQVFDPSLHAHAVAVLRTEMELRRALERSEFRLYYQPIVSLGHNLGMLVVAEGVETAEQLRDLRKLGCDYAQGFLFSPAVEASAAEALLGDAA